MFYDRHIVISILLAALCGCGLVEQDDVADVNESEWVGEMVLIPGGSFRMGDMNGEGWDHEKPVHSVTVPAFKLGKHEVTVGQFRRFVEATGYRTDAERNANGNAGCYTYTSCQGSSKIPQLWSLKIPHPWFN